MPRESLFAEALYEQLFRQGIRYFMPQCGVVTDGQLDERELKCEFRALDPALVEVRWLGRRHRVANPKTAFTTDQWRMINSVGTVLSVRLQLLVAEGLTPHNFHLFRGLDEDRYVSAFLDPVAYADASARFPDRAGDAIEVLRASSLASHEGSRLSAGALLLGREPEPGPCAARNPDAVPYASALNSIRSFYKICDGVQTVAVVDPEGRFIDLADIRDWSAALVGVELPIPCPARYEPHARATLSGGNVCMVLTPNQEIKVFASGREALRLLNGRWRLMDIHEKFRQWKSALSDETLASCLFRAALNVSEDRDGALFVILDDPRIAAELVAGGSLVENQPQTLFLENPSKEHLHYLVRNKRATEIPPTVLESIARVDGAILFDRDSRILAFGAILQTPCSRGREFPTEGGRTTAALSASRYGKVLKISEDGPISFYDNESVVWEL